MGPNNIGQTADYDGYGSENGIDKDKNSLDSSYFDTPQTTQAIPDEQPGANARAIAEELNQRNSERGETAIAASEARNESLETAFMEKEALNEAHEKDPSNEKIIAYLKQVNDYIAKLISELNRPPEMINTISSRKAEDMTSTQATIDSRQGVSESAEKSADAEDNDLAYLGKDSKVYDNPQDARDSFAA